jgi:protein O-mannosyl-transferase
MTELGRRWQKGVVGLLLGVAVLIVFWPALTCGFVDFDDQDYITQNRDVCGGLNWRSLKWAFTTEQATYWHPVTWISHLLDCQLYGLEPAGHHLTNVLLHAANAVLLFLLLRHLTGALWPSAFVAAIFALHPLRVESVVWISERKDVLSTFFWMLAVGAYVRYAEHLKAQKSDFKFYYLLALVFYALGLMAKQMLVTLPFVLLLLDYWPMGRLELGPKFSWRLVVEKLPFFALSMAASLVIFLVQNHLGAVKSLTRFPLSERLANVPDSYVRYIAKNFWPSGLSIFYAHRPLGFLEVGGALGVIGAVSLLVVWRWRAQPYLAVGWLWFLGMLVPTLGLVQSGLQSMADRFCYVASVGLWIMVAWGVRDLIGTHRLARVGAALAGGAAIVVCMVLTPMQISHWQSSGDIIKRATDLVDQQYWSCYNLGCKAMELGDYPLAIRDFQEALSTEQEIPILSDHSLAYNNLGYAFLHEGQIASAVTNFQIALMIRPFYAEAYFNLGRAFLLKNQPKAAVDYFQKALTLKPGVAATHCQLANTLVLLDRNAEAIAEYSQALRLAPGDDEAANNLASLLATCPERALRDGARAVALARQASEHNHDQNPVILGTLAAAYAETGDLVAAIATTQRARQLALAQHNQAYVGVLESQLRQYQVGAGGSNR